MVSNKKVVIRCLYGIITVLLCFYSLLIGVYQLPPFYSLMKIKQFVTSIGQDTSMEGVYFRTAFSDSLPNSVDLIYPPIAHNYNYKHLAKVVSDQLETIPAKDFFNVYYKIELGVSEYINNNILKVPFNIKDYRGTAYAYKLSAKGAIHVGTLVIPGTGDNQSSEILHNHGYHGLIANSVTKYSDLFIQIKPNSDSRALHDGNGKLISAFIDVHLLRKGYSYSSNYLVEALALIKYLKKHYRNYGTIGLSQGGEATLLTSLQSEPTFAIIASGFSPYIWDLCEANPNQIHIPELYNYYTLEFIQDTLKTHKTKYHFTFGKKELGIYGIDRKNNITKNFLKKTGNDNIHYKVHNDGHTFDLEYVERILSSF